MDRRIKELVRDYTQEPPVVFRREDARAMNAAALLKRLLDTHDGLVSTGKAASRDGRGRTSQRYGKRAELLSDAIDWIRLSEDELAAARAESAKLREALADMPIAALNDAVGLVASERNRWENVNPRTSQHWADVYTQLAALLLVSQVMQDVKAAETAPTKDSE